MKKDLLCPAQIKAAIISRDKTQDKPTESQQKGLTFEKLCLKTQAPDYMTTQAILGSTPKLKNGELSADYKRICEQAERFIKEMIPEYELDLTSSEGGTRAGSFIDMEADFNDEITLFGQTDFVSSMLDDVLGKIPIAIHDLKLTGSIFKQWGTFSWASPHNMDHTQAYQYIWLVKKLTGYTVPFYYWVFDYSPDKNFKLLRKETTALGWAEYEESVRVSAERYKLFAADGWKAENPSSDNCGYCPLKLTCPSANKRQTIEII